MSAQIIHVRNDTSAVILAKAGDKSTVFARPLFGRSNPLKRLLGIWRLVHWGPISEYIFD